MRKPKNTFSTSALSLKAKIKWLLPACLIWKPCLALHKDPKVLATASMFTAFLVKNLAAKTNSWICFSLDRVTLLPSLFERDNLVQRLVRSFIISM